MTLEKFDSLCLSVMKINELESGEKEKKHESYSKQSEIEKAIAKDPAIRRIVKC